MYLKQSFAIMLGLAATLTVGGAMAQYPSKAVTIVVPNGAGSTTDTVMRAIADPLAKALAQPVVIENRPGANTDLGTQFVAKAAADGYTLLEGTSAMVANAAGLMPRVSYDPVKDFTPITLLGSGTYMLVVSSQQPWNSLRELLDQARANPGKLNYASGSLGGILYMELLKKSAGVHIVHIPYKATPPALMDVIGGQVHMMITDVGTAAANAKAGRIRALVSTSSPQRSPLFPQVPTFIEAGIPGMLDMPGWLALYGPAGMPKEAVSRLNREVNAILKRPEIQEKMLTGFGFSLAGSTPEELGTFTSEQVQRYVHLLREFKIQPLN